MPCRLLEKVIDIEVAAGTASPTIDPSVRTILLGHSMGGIVAAETVVGLTSEEPIYSEDGVEKSSSSLPSLNSLMFPYIQGVLGFDTPYLGISPGVVAHGAEGHYQNAAAAYTSITSLFGASAATATAAAAKPKPVAALPAPPASSSASSGGWNRWGKVAMYAGAAGAAAAAAGAAYYNREQLTEGMSWATSHLEFVGSLARPEEMKKRVAYMVRLKPEMGVGFGNLYTRLGNAAVDKPVGVMSTVLGSERTFCNLPAGRQPAGTWKQAVNEKATDETLAHMSELLVI